MWRPEIPNSGAKQEGVVGEVGEVQRTKGFKDKVLGYVKGAVAGGLIAMASSEEALSADKSPQPKSVSEKPKVEKKIEGGKVEKFPLPGGGFRVETTRGEVTVTTYEGVSVDNSPRSNFVPQANVKKITNGLGNPATITTYEGVGTGPSKPAKIFNEEYQRVLDNIPGPINSTEISDSFKKLSDNIVKGSSEVKTGIDYKNFLKAVEDGVKKNLNGLDLRALPIDELLKVAKTIEEIADIISDRSHGLVNENGQAYNSRDHEVLHYQLLGICRDFLGVYDSRINKIGVKKFQF